MILTLNPATIGGTPPLREYVALAQKHGFGGVEFNLGDAVALGQEIGLAGVKALFEEAGVQPAVFGIPVEWRKSEAEFEAGLKLLPEQAKAAQAIGAVRTCTWIPPAVNDDALLFRNQTRDRFHQMARVLGDCGIRFGLEWVGPYTLRHGPKAMGANEFIWNMPAILELIADIDAPQDNVGLLADSFHWFTTGRARRILRRFRPRRLSMCISMTHRTSRVTHRWTANAFCRAMA